MNIKDKIDKIEREKRENDKAKSEEEIQRLKKELEEIKEKSQEKDNIIESLEKNIKDLTPKEEPLKQVPEKEPIVLIAVETPHKRLDKAFNSKDWNQIQQIITNEIDLNDQNYKTDLVKRLVRYSNSLGYNKKYERANVLEFTRKIQPSDLDLGKKLIDIYESLENSEYLLETLVKELLEQNPQDYKLKSVLSSALIKKAKEQGKYNLQDAIPIYEELVKLNENNDYCANHLKAKYKNLLKTAYMDAERFDDIIELISGESLFRKLETLISNVKSKLPSSNEYSELRYRFRTYINEKFNELDTFEEKETILKKNLELNSNRTDQSTILMNLSDLYRNKSTELYQEAAGYSEEDSTKERLESLAFKYKHKAYEVWD